MIKIMHEAKAWISLIGHRQPHARAKQSARRLAAPTLGQ